MTVIERNSLHGFDDLGYETKPIDYFRSQRTEMIPFVPEECQRVLDVGCGDGTFGESLKRIRQIEVWGVEPTKSAAAVAKTKLDNVIEGVFAPELTLPLASFDCVVFNDVLEHMFVPESALRYARTLLTPGGVIVASIPNIRSFPTIWRLMIHARWDYQDTGVLDRTHLRFFTKSTMVEMFKHEGFNIEMICGINAYAAIPNVGPRIWLAHRIVNFLAFNLLEDMKYQQFAVIARGK